MLWDYTQVYYMSNHKIKIMSKCNYNFDPFVANASAALYGVENQNAVQENFHELYLKLVEHFRDPEFIGKLHALKGRGQVTVAIELPMKNDGYGSPTSSGSRYRNHLPSIGKCIMST